MSGRGRYFFHPTRTCTDREVLYGNSRMGAGAFSAGNPANLGFLDVACSMPLGCNGESSRPPRESSINEACMCMFSHSFGRGPCYIPFSGGRESSVWVALGTRYARDHGYDDPVPVTLRHPGLASTEELQVQERVVAHLGLTEWERVEAEQDDLDLVGPVARDTLVRTGPIWPANAYVMAPLVEASRGGVYVFLTGLGDFFSWWRWGALASVLALDRRPARRDLRLVAAAMMPASLRVRAAARHHAPPPMPWLRPAAEREALALLRRRQAEAPIRFDRAVTKQVTHRCFEGAAGTFDAFGKALGTSIDQPLRRLGVVDSFAGAGGWRGFSSAGEMLRRLCGNLLPADVLTARPGLDLTRVFFGEASREFATNWTGEGLDESIVDTEVLRHSWLSATPDPRTACLLQYAWLTEQASVAGSKASAGELVLTQSTTKESP